MRRSLPPLFVALGSTRALWMLGGAALFFGAAMLPAMATMADHGASVIAFEAAGSASRSTEILADWGAAGKSASWWQLAIDTPFLLAYGLFLAGACTAVARRANETGRPRLERAAMAFAWLGPIAALADFAQNVSLALVLAGHVAQPWPLISAVATFVTPAFALAAALFAIVGTITTRRPASGLRRPARPPI